jgi:hypothetical protein
MKEGYWVKMGVETYRDKRSCEGYCEITEAFARRRIGVDDYFLPR